jgi:copper chaperone CopZ
MKRATFTIEGMHCTGCARTIEMVLAAEPGVKETAVSFESKDARVLYDAALTGEERLAVAIEKAGHRVQRPS